MLFLKGIPDKKKHKKHELQREKTRILLLFLAKEERVSLFLVATVTVTLHLNKVLTSRELPADLGGSFVSNVYFLTLFKA